MDVENHLQEILREAAENRSLIAKIHGTDFPWCSSKRHCMEDTTKAMFAFSKLTEINSRRSARYTAAAQQVKNIHLKIVFMNYAYQAQQLNADLKRWILAYGVHPVQHTESSFNMALDKLWSFFGLNSESSVFSACEELEEEALKKYRTALVLNFLPDAAVRDIERQLREIQKIKDNLKNMRQNHIYELQAA